MAANDQGSLREHIFPSGPVRDGHIIRTAMVETWESQLIGLGRLTAFVSPRLLNESHAVDDAALGVVYLQRHRVEVALKLILERAERTYRPPTSSRPLEWPPRRHAATRPSATIGALSSARTPSTSS